MAPRIFPESVRQMHASKRMRLRHELWHFVRAVWGHPAFPEEGRQILRNLGWGLPNDRSPFSASQSMLLDNYAGEDFLFMHRQMIEMTDRALSAEGEAPISRWESVPEPGDTEFPVPEAWDYNDPSQSAQSNAGTTQFLRDVKSDGYFGKTMRIREAFLTDPSNLRRLSLGALGNIAEMTIHNMIHMRWAEDPGGYRPGVDISNPTAGDPQWDDLSYDYLGDTYSSHVNPHFWYLHGWIDNLIDKWAAANRVTNIRWVGTWVGGPDLVPEDDDPVIASARMTAVPEMRLDLEQISADLQRLAELSMELQPSSSLVQIARTEFVL